LNMGDKYNPATQPFHTTNAILAFCLHMAGVPWHDNRHAVRVYYSAQILNKMVNGYGEPFYKGWELEKAVEHAYKNNKRGHVEYAFERTPRIKPLCIAFSEQEDQFEDDTKRTLTQVIQEILYTKAADDIKLVRLACVFLKTRVPFMELWKHQV